MVNKIDYVDFQRRTQPLAYLITFRCYGTWLHGDERGSVNRRNRNIFGQPGLPASKKLVELEKADLKSPAVTLDEPERRIVEKAIREVCRHRAYTLFAIISSFKSIRSVIVCQTSSRSVRARASNTSSLGLKTLTRTVCWARRISRTRSRSIARCCWRGSKQRCSLIAATSLVSPTTRRRQFCTTSG